MGTILFAGGGTLGHILPSLAVQERLPSHQSTFFLIGTKQAEIDAVINAGMPFASLNVPPFPPVFSVDFLLFPFRFLRAFVRSFFFLTQQNVSVVFSKGGYVSVPVCLAAYSLRIPIVWHASDSVLSRSDRCFLSLASVFCTGFPLDDLGLSSSPCIRCTGNPVRSLLCKGSKDEALRITNLRPDQPTVLIMGGSQGALSINQAVQTMLDELLIMVQVIHLTGEGKGVTYTHPSYYTCSFADGEHLSHLYALADIVVSRAGAGSISELAALRKPTILIPLEGVAHDHQVRNAEVLATANAALHLPQSQIDELPTLLRETLSGSQTCITLGTNLHHFFPLDAAASLATILLDEARGTQIE
jgi:UDP-N-acetylglucosamine--N-acetylmuramyl-(pentapeptide) pyrophosphoryl-undecaprenol N-acetylglucosamine transferase